MESYVYDRLTVRYSRHMDVEESDVEYSIKCVGRKGRQHFFVVSSSEFHAKIIEIKSDPRLRVVRVNKKKVSAVGANMLGDECSVHHTQLYSSDTQNNGEKKT